MIVLEPGDPWIVKLGETHTDRILEFFTAIEATAPPVQAHGLDEYPSQ